MNSLLVTSCDILELQAGGIQYGTMGLFKFNNPLDESSTACVDITSIADRDIEDNAFLCSKISSLISLGFGSIVFIYLFFKQCIVPLPRSGLILDIGSAGVQISLSLVHVLWISEICDAYTCVNGQGIWYLIAAQGAWLIVGCCSRCMRDGPRENKDKHHDDDDVEEEEYVEDDDRAFKEER